MKQDYKLYKGEVVLNFDDSKHIYSVNKKVVYGVTSITGVIGKPGLVYWAANKGAEAFQVSVKPGEVLDEVRIKDIANLIKTSHRQVKDAAADIGTLIHNWLSAFLKAGITGKPLPKKPLNPKMKNAIESFLAWTKKNKVKFHEPERKVYSRKYGYAGTCDAIATVNGKPTIVDFKTGNAIYPEYFLQTVAYQAALQEELKQKFTHNLILRLSQENKEKDILPFEVRETENHKENFKAFLACLQIYKWQQANRKAEILNNLNGIN